MSGLALAVGACSPGELGLGGSDSESKASLHSAAAMMEMGDKVWASGDAAAAARFYLAAANAAPGEVEPKLKLARALQTLGAHRAAISVFDAVLATKPDAHEARRGLANALISLDRPRDAVVHFEKVIAATGDYRAYNGLGVAQDMLGDHKAAIAAYKAGLAKEPASLTLRNNYGLSLALAGHYREATDILHEVAADKHATARHRQNLALVYGLSGNFGYAAQIARIDLDAPAVARNLAYYAWLRRQPRAAVNKAIKEGPPAKLTSLPAAAPAKAPEKAPAKAKAAPAKPRKEAKIERLELQPKAKPKAVAAHPQPKAAPRLKETAAAATPAPMQKSTAVLPGKAADKPANAKAAAKTAARVAHAKLAEANVAAVKPPLKAPLKAPVKPPVKAPIKTVAKPAPQAATARADIDIWAMPAPAETPAKAAPQPAPKAEMPKAEMPKAKMPGAEAPTAPAPKAEAPKAAETPMTEARPRPAAGPNADILAAARAPQAPMAEPTIKPEPETKAPMPLKAPEEAKTPAAGPPEAKAPETKTELTLPAARADIDIWAIPGVPAGTAETKAAKTVAAKPAAPAAKPEPKPQAKRDTGGDDKTSVIVPLLPERSGKAGAAPKGWNGVSLDGGASFQHARLIFARAERGDGDTEVWIFPAPR